MRLLAIIALLCFFAPIQAQEKEKELIQLSGVILDADSLNPIPFTSVMISGTNRGTISDYYGFFSVVAAKGDTIVFSSLGYENNAFVVPDSIQSLRYSLIQVLTTDTIELQELVVYPWPTREQFKDAFINLDMTNDEVFRMQMNMAYASARNRKVGATYSTTNANAAYRVQNMNRQTALYNSGMAPTIQLMNPFAWAQFINSWKKGDYKK